MQMRLAYMHKYIDHFFICEKRYTYQGKKKETLYIEQYKDWFAPFLKKITFLVDETEPFADSWKNEFTHRNYSRPHIEAYGDAQCKPYMTIVADVDEIPEMNLFTQNMEALYEESKEGIVVLNQLQYYYNLHWFTHPSAAAFLISDIFMKKEPDFQKHRGRNGTVACEFDCGWHFSFFMTRDEIRRKIESFAHTECNKDEFKTEEAIDRCFFEGKDLFNRAWMNACFRREEPTIRDYPPEIYAFHEYIKGLQQDKTKNGSTGNTQ